MSLQPAIPWQVALPQGLPPLQRPGSECAKVILPVENFAANGEHGLNCLCQPRGQPQLAPPTYRKSYKVLTTTLLKSEGILSLYGDRLPRSSNALFMDSSNRVPGLWVAFRLLETRRQTSKRFIPLASARCI